MFIFGSPLTCKHSVWMGISEQKRVCFCLKSRSRAFSRPSRMMPAAEFTVRRGCRAANQTAWDFLHNSHSTPVKGKTQLKTKYVKREIKSLLLSSRATPSVSGLTGRNLLHTRRCLHTSGPIRSERNQPRLASSQIWSHIGWRAPPRSTAFISSWLLSWNVPIISNRWYLIPHVSECGFSPPTPHALNNQWLHFAAISIKLFPILATASPRSPPAAQKQRRVETCSTNPATCWSAAQSAFPLRPAIYSPLSALSGNESWGRGRGWRFYSTFNFFPNTADKDAHTKHSAPVKEGLRYFTGIRRSWLHFQQFLFQSCLHTIYIGL